METNTVTPALSNPKPSTSGATATDIAGDMDTFLKMLSVQMQNQDPLNPMESQDFAVQLATFSGVEQQVETNRLLKSIAAQSLGAGLSTYAGWIGMDAPTTAPVSFDGNPLTILPARAANATSSRLNILTESGRLLGSISLEPSQDVVNWSGAAGDAGILPSGIYRFETESFDGSGSLGVTASGAYQRINEVRMENGKPLLVTSGGHRISPETISGLRAG